MTSPTPTPPKIRAYVPAVGPRLRPLLYTVLVLFALLAVDGGYLATITFAEWITGETYQNYVYIYLFLAHLVLGLLLIVPLVVFTSRSWFTTAKLGPSAAPKRSRSLASLLSRSISTKW